MNEGIVNCTNCKKTINTDNIFINYNLISEGRVIIEEYFCDDECLLKYINDIKK